jgi:6-phosphogluconolactonase
VFATDPTTGDLYQREAVDVLGEWPRHFALTPDGRLMVVGNQDSDSLISFFVDREGALTRTGHSCETSSPANVRF